jgi:hypothetical protein
MSRRQMLLALVGLTLPAQLLWGQGASAQAQTSPGSILDRLPRGVLPGRGGLTAREADMGLREALNVGADVVVASLGRTDGFWGSDRFRIPLPGQLASLQRRLQRLGMAGPLDELQLKINRAAEAAVPEAKALVVDAIANLTIEDAVGLVRGGNTAGTDLLARRTRPAIAARFRPHLDGALDQSGAFRALDRALSALPLASGLGLNAASLKGQIADFAVNSALDAVFTRLGEEEAAIRRDPVRQGTALLRRVFGG